MSYGIFESASTDGFEQQERQAAATKNLDLAAERVARRFGEFLCAADDKQDFEDRVALVKPEMMKVVEAAGVMPVTGVMRKVVGRQRTLWHSASRKQTAATYRVEEGVHGPTLTVTDNGQEYSFGVRGEGGFGPPTEADIKAELERHGYGDATQTGDTPDFSHFGSRTASVVHSDTNTAPGFTGQVTESAIAQGSYNWQVTQDSTGDLMDHGRNIDSTMEATLEMVECLHTCRDQFTASKVAGETGDGLSDADELIPEDNWDGYLNEQSTEDTNKVKQHNFASRDVISWRGNSASEAQEFINYAKTNGVILKDWPHVESLLVDFMSRQSLTGVEKTSFKLELRNNKDEVIQALRSSGVYAASRKTAMTLDEAVAWVGDMYGPGEWEDSVDTLVKMQGISEEEAERLLGNYLTAASREFAAAVMKSANQVPEGKYFDPITEQMYDDDAGINDRSLPPGYFYDEITDQVYLDDDHFSAAVMRTADIDTGEQTDLVDVDDTRTDPGAWDNTSDADPTF